MNVKALKELLDAYEDEAEVVAEWEGQKIKFCDLDIYMDEGVLAIWVDNHNHGNRK